MKRGESKTRELAISKQMIDIFFVIYSVIHKAYQSQTSDYICMCLNWGLSESERGCFLEVCTTLAGRMNVRCPSSSAATGLNLYLESTPYAY